MKSKYELLKQAAKKVAKEQNIQLKEALSLIAKENDHQSWKDLKDSLNTFWYHKASPFLNHWFSNYQEAKNYFDQNGGHLLSYKNNFFIASKEYIEFLGLDPNNKAFLEFNNNLADQKDQAKFFKRYEYYKKEL